MKKPELLAPAGNLEKLKIAYQYGADACYIGGHVFGLRKYAENFNNTQLKEAIDLANISKKKLYLVLNGFAHNKDLDALKPHLDFLQTIQPHAFIISDMGVFQLAKAHTNIPLHVSTQASVTNAYHAQVWKDAGAKRVILARETSIEDAKHIQSKTGLQVETFIHGAMCASYSGKCVISNYTAGRDSNRGGCIQSCRHTYDLIDHDDTSHKGQYMMNAKDLMGVSLLPTFIKAGIDSVKIEGRMKSNLYAANSASCYRQAIDYCYQQLQQNKPIDFNKITDYEQSLSKVSNRTFSTGGLENRPFGESIAYDFPSYSKHVEFIGTLKDVSPQQGMVLEVRFPFECNDLLELQTNNGTITPFKVTSITNTLGEPINNKTKPNSIVTLPFVKGAHYQAILRKPL